MVILHGENHFKSRGRLAQLIETASQAGLEITRLEASKTPAARLQEALGSSSLFGAEQTLIIEGLHSLPTGAKKKQLLEIVEAAATAAGAPAIILWENRELTKTMLKRFGQAQVENFPISKTMFKWLDSLSPQSSTKAKQLKLLHQTLTEENDFIALSMLIRQFKLLLTIKAGGQAKAPPFVIRQLTSQARQFSQDQLTDALKELLQIDFRQKQSASNFSLGKELDLLILKL